MTALAVTKTTLNFDPTRAIIQSTFIEGKEWWVLGNDGVYWHAQSEKNLLLRPNDQVRVLRRENNTLIISQ